MRDTIAEVFRAMACFFAFATACRLLLSGNHIGAAAVFTAIHLLSPLLRKPPCTNGSRGDCLEG